MNLAPASAQAVRVTLPAGGLDALGRAGPRRARWYGVGQLERRGRRVGHVVVVEHDAGVLGVVDHRDAAAGHRAGRAGRLLRPRARGRRRAGRRARRSCVGVAGSRGRRRWRQSRPVAAGRGGCPDLGMAGGGEVGAWREIAEPRARGAASRGGSSSRCPCAGCCSWGEVVERGEVSEVGSRSRSGRAACRSRGAAAPASAVRDRVEAIGGLGEQALAAGWGRRMLEVRHAERGAQGGRQHLGGRQLVAEIRR